MVCESCGDETHLSTFCTQVLLQLGSLPDLRPISALYEGMQDYLLNNIYHAYRMTRCRIQYQEELRWVYRFIDFIIDFLFYWFLRANFSSHVVFSFLILIYWLLSTHITVRLVDIRFIDWLSIPAITWRRCFGWRFRPMCDCTCLVPVATGSGSTWATWTSALCFKTKIVCKSD